MFSVWEIAATLICFIIPGLVGYSRVQGSCGDDKDRFVGLKDTIQTAIFMGGMLYFMGSKGLVKYLILVFGSSFLLYIVPAIYKWLTKPGCKEGYDWEGG